MKGMDFNEYLIEIYPKLQTEQILSIYILLNLEIIWYLERFFFQKTFFEKLKNRKSSKYIKFNLKQMQ